MPRVATLNAGTSRRIMPLSKMIAASAPRSSASRNSTIECPPVSSSPSQQKRTFTGSSPARASSRAADEQHVELALVVDGAAAVQIVAADLRLERVALPQLERVGRLHVEVPVADHRRRALRSARRAQLADRERLAVPVDHLALAARLADQRAHPLRRPLDVGGVRGVRADRGDAEELRELVEPVGHGAGERTNLVPAKRNQVLRDVSELLAVGQRAELLQALVLDLADPLARHLERAADLVERARLLAVQAVAQARARGVRGSSASRGTWRAPRRERRCRPPRRAAACARPRGTARTPTPPRRPPASRARRASARCGGSTRPPRPSCRGRRRSPRSSARGRALRAASARCARSCSASRRRGPACGSCAPCRRAPVRPPGGSTRSRRSRTCSPCASRTSRRRARARSSPPGSGRGTGAPGCGSAWRSRRRGAGSPRPSPASRDGRRARCASRARPPARR